MNDPWRPYEPCRENEQLAAFIRLVENPAIGPWFRLLFGFGLIGGVVGPDRERDSMQRCASE
jgi:hypothetical protein